jgi:citrate lyase subunit beta/citryl-CoA lyase
VDAEVTRLEGTAGLEPGGIRFHCLVETVSAVVRVAELARASARAAALLFGAGDLMRETRGRLTPTRTSELCALTHLVLAARLQGLDAIDAPYFQLGDAAGLDVHARLAADLGYDGKAVIHPGQIDTVNAVFTPTCEAVADARRILDAFAAADAAGTGALQLDGRFIDAVHVAIARETLARARLAGVA